MSPCGKVAVGLGADVFLGGILVMGIQSGVKVGVGTEGSQVGVGVGPEVFVGVGDGVSVGVAVGAGVFVGVADGVLVAVTKPV